MELCKAGQIQNCCHPNALMTLEEFLVDYASPETQKIGDELIEKEIANIGKDTIKETVKNELIKIEDGKRDIYF